MIYFFNLFTSVHLSIPYVFNFLFAPPRYKQVRKCTDTKEKSKGRK